MSGLRIWILLACLAVPGLAAGEASAPPASPESIPALAADFRALQAKARDLTGRFGHALDPLAIRDSAALRFINRPDWESFVTRGGARGTFDPRDVYDPKPMTWENWQRVTQSSVQVAALHGTPLTLEMMQAWNEGAILGTVPGYVPAGKLKESGNYGRDVTRATSLSPDEIRNLQSVHLEGEAPPALHWTTLACQEDLPANLPLPGFNRTCASVWIQAQRLARAEAHGKLTGPGHPDPDFWRRTQSDLAHGIYQDRWYWFACWPRAGGGLWSGGGAERLGGANPERRCGMIRYPDPQRVRARLLRVLDAVNRYFNTPARPEDPIRFALRMQRETVALHPFDKGNGRASRWIMDYVTLRAGLPPILVRNMDFDLSTDEETYYRQGLAGAREFIARTGDCLARYAGEEFTALQSTICGVLP